MAPPASKNMTSVKSNTPAAKQDKTTGGAAIGKPSLRNHRPHTPSPSYTEIPHSVSFELISEIRLFREEMEKMRTDMQEFKAVFSGLAAAVTKCNESIEELSARMDAVERRQNEELTGDTTYLDHQIAALKLDLNNRDQQLLGNDIEIAGIPEAKNEQSTHLALVIANKLGVSIEERDIVSAERVGPERQTEESGAGGARGQPRPRPLVVRLTRRAPRDQLLAAARVRREVTTDGMGLGEPARRFYVNERLTRQNRLLFNKAREEAARVHWKYVWTRDGAVFARKEHGAPRHRLRMESDLAKVFGL